MQYIRDSKEMTLTIEPDYNPQWWVDSSNAAQLDMKSHPRIYMTIGKGAKYTSSCKQNINTMISMEAELLGVEDAMRQLLWTHHFLARDIRTNNKNTSGQQEYHTNYLKWKII